MPEPSPVAAPRRLRLDLPRNVWVTAATSFLNDISSEMILNLVPLFLANVLGVAPSVIGLIEGIAASISSLLKTLFGWWSDRMGSRKGLAVAGYALSSLAKPMLLFVSSWGGVLAVRVADRVGKGIRAAPRDALLADSVDERQRGLAFGLHRAGDTAGAFVGMVVALLVVLASQWQALALTRETFQLLVALATVPALLAVVVLAVGAREPARRRPSAAPRLSLRGLEPRLRAYIGIVALFALGNSSDAFLILRAQERGLSVAGVLGMLITFNAVYALVAGPAGALSDRVGRYRLLAGGWLLYAALYFGFAASTAAWHIWALYAAYGLYYGLVEGAARALIADLVPAERRGIAFGAYHGAVGLAALPASLLAGLLWQTLGPAAPFLFGAALALLAALLLTAWHRAG